MFNLDLFEELVVNNLNSTNLEYIKIIGLFGCHDVELHFDKEVNVYIGENGLGKTTILNCVYYILKKRYVKLAEIDFDEIYVKFSQEKKVFIVSISDINTYNERRINKRSYFDDEYIEFIIQDLIRKPSDFNVVNEEAFEIATRKLARIMDIPSSMARRQLLQYFKTSEVFLDKKLKKGDDRKVDDLNSALDKNITQDILYLTTYRRIEDDFSNLLNKEEKFRDNDMLIRFGMSDVDKSIKGMLGLIRENSRENFNKMTSVLLKQYASANKVKNYTPSNISIDIVMLKIILDRLGNEIAEEDRTNIISLFDSGNIYEDNYSYLLDLISKLIENYDKQKVYDDKIKNFEYTCNKYLNGKKFVYNQSELRLDVKLLTNNDEESNIIELTKLSSGEKQIVSLFSKLYLDNDKDSILIIDEPELSLSMKWQKMLLPDIMRSGSCKLLLTVTHSPFIFENEFDLDAKEMRNCITNSNKEE
jgi:predicted ATP-binding protein involved in virulence